MQRLQTRQKLDFSHGAILISAEGDSAVVEGSPAGLAGLEDEDIILEIMGVQLILKTP